MTKEELIAKQQLKIECLREKISLHDKRIKELHFMIYGIGSPLNDNKLKYSPAQLVPFGKIANLFDL